MTFDYVLGCYRRVVLQSTIIVTNFREFTVASGTGIHFVAFYQAMVA